MKILVVDDEALLVKGIRFNLQNEGYEVKTAGDGIEGISYFKMYEPDLVLLDIMMPKKDGWQVCREIRKKSDCPIIMITAKGETFDKVLGLELGADDYVTKPFSPSELTARIDALCRRLGVDNTTETVQEADDENVLISGPFKLDYKSRTLYKNNTSIDLTQVEFQIMEYLMQNPNVALKRSEILHAVWGESYTGEEKAVDVNVRRLRVKIEDDSSDPQYLATAWGYGYKWVPAK